MTANLGPLAPAPALTLEQRVARLEAVLGFAIPSSPADPVPFALRKGALLREAARLWFLSVEDITGPRQYREFVLARAAITMILREGPTPMSYPQIGALLGGRDHSTIINLEQVARRAMNERPGFARAIEEMRASFQPKQEEASA